MYSRQFILRLVLAAAFSGAGRGVLPAQQADTTRPPPGPAGPTNPRLLPDLSVVGDLIFDLSPKGSTQESGKRFGVREIEVALQAAVDPYFRATSTSASATMKGCRSSRPS